MPSIRPFEDSAKLAVRSRLRIFVQGAFRESNKCELKRIVTLRHRREYGMSNPLQIRKSRVDLRLPDTTIQQYFQRLKSNGKKCVLPKLHSLRTSISNALTGKRNRTNRFAGSFNGMIQDNRTGAGMVSMFAVHRKRGISCFDYPTKALICSHFSICKPGLAPQAKPMR